MIAETVEEFVEWATDQQNEEFFKVNERIYGQDLHNAFVSDNSDFQKLSNRVFYRWIDAYINYKFKTSAKWARDMRGKYFMIEGK